MKKALSLFFVPALFMLTACASQNGQNTQYSQTTSLTTSTAASADAQNQAQLATPQPGDTVAILETDMGTVKFKLFTQQVPTLTTNFMELAKAGKYDGSPFHRVVKDFMIQGGDFENHDGTGGYSYKGPNTALPNEIDPSLHHLYGTVSMAKTAAPVSIGSQFFIVTAKDGTPFLDGSYSPIGQVYEGMDVAEKIQDLQVPGTEEPSKMVNIKKVTITTYANDQAGNTQG